MSDRLDRAVRRWLRPAGVAIDERPRTPFDVQMKQRVDDHARELAEIRNRVNGLFFLSTGAILIDILIRLTK